MYKTGVDDPPRGLRLPTLEVLDAQSMPLTRWNLGPWQFPYWRMYWADRPGTWVVADTPIAIDNRHVVLVPPQTTVALRQSRPVRHFYCHFVLGPPLAAWGMPAFRVTSDAWLKRAQATLLGEALADPLPTHLGLPLAGIIHQCLDAAPRPYWDAVNVDSRVRQALLFIARSPHEPLDGPQLAARAHLSPHAFARLFRKQVGQSLHQYVLRSRVQSASNLLLTTDLSIKQIAARLGFCDRYHFSRVFRAVRGVPPARFRANAEANR